jgi:hypothetical protein
MSTTGYEWTHSGKIYYDRFTGQVKGEVIFERGDMYIAYGYGIAREDELIGRYVREEIAREAIEEAVSAWDGS